MAFKLLLDDQEADHEGRQRHHDGTLEALPKAAENILLGPHGAHLRRAGKGLRAVQGAHYSSGRGSLPRSIRSKSPGFSDSSHSLILAGSSPFPVPISVSLATSTVRALCTTSSSTKIGAPTRSARAMASDGRESTVMSAPPRRRWMTA